MRSACPVRSGMSMATTCDARAVDAAAATAATERHHERSEDRTDISMIIRRESTKTSDLTQCERPAARGGQVGGREAAAPFHHGHQIVKLVQPPLVHAAVP